MAKPNRVAANITNARVYQAGNRSVWFVHVTRRWYEVQEVRTAEGGMYTVGDVRRGPDGWTFTPSGMGPRRGWNTTVTATARVDAVRAAAPTEESTP